MFKATFIIPELQKLRQEDYFKSKSRLGYIVSTRIAVAILQNPGSKTNKKCKS